MTDFVAEGSGMNWKDCCTMEKLLRIAGLLIAVIVLISAILKYRNIWSDGLYLSVPLLGILQAINAALYWKKDRDQAAIFLLIACFTGIVSIAVFIL